MHLTQPRSLRLPDDSVSETKDLVLMWTPVDVEQQEKIKDEVRVAAVSSRAKKRLLDFRFSQEYSPPLHVFKPV